MELTACVKAFEEISKYPNIRRFRRIIVFSDSTYLTDNQNRAMWDWPRNKYRKTTGGLVENADIWEKWLKGRRKLSRLLWEIQIDLVWKERRSNDHMKAVDKLAKRASGACGSDGKPFRAVGVRRHRMPVKPGAVNFFGQKMTIYVVTSEEMKVQKMNKYSCQVISRGSAYYRQKDIIYSPHQLKEGHRYTVTCTERQDDPGTCDIQIHRKYKTKKEIEQASSEDVKT